MYEIDIYECSYQSPLTVTEKSWPPFGFLPSDSTVESARISALRHDIYVQGRVRLRIKCMLKNLYSKPTTRISAAVSVITMLE